MSVSSRREFVLSAAMASAILGLDRQVAISAPAFRRKTVDPEPGFHRYKIGEAECIALFDGVWEKAHDPAYFKNASVKDTKRALAAAGLRSDFVPIPISALVVKVNNKLVLCDAGGGQSRAVTARSVFISGKLIANLKAAGIAPEAIETILISHFHSDHIFGLLSAKTDEPVFPNAEIIVPAAEYRWWTDPSLIGRLPEPQRPLVRRIQAIIPNWPNVLPVEGEDEVVAGIRFVSAPGHTVGHTAFHLSSGKAELLISGDAIYLPAFVAAHPEWQGNYDQDGPKAVETRRRLLDRVVADRMKICGTHFPWPGVGDIARDGRGYAFEL
jgi:glyoxylase-like metal-dependent hydrolase (beta-lactamase superfamily II)